MRIETPGGGGYGPPQERPDALIVRDLRDGYVTLEEARRWYGAARVDRLTAAGDLVAAA